MKQLCNYILIAGILLAAMFVVSLMACGGGTKKSDAVEFIIANGAEPETIDPLLASDTASSNIIRNMFESFFMYDPQGKIINGLVESYIANDDGDVYQFTLRDGLVWSDGVPLTTDDVLFSLQRILDPATASPYAWFPALFIKNGDAFNKGKVSANKLGIRIIDKRTFELTLVGPLPYVTDALTHFAFDAVPKHVIEKHGKDWTLAKNIVVSGPFTLKEWAPQDKLAVQKNPRYWDADNVALDQVVFLPSDDNNTSYNSYINGEVDWTTAVPLGRLDEAKLRDDYYVAPIFATYYYSLQFHKPELSDVRVREALARAIDKKNLVDNVSRGGQTPTNALVPPLSAYTPVTGYDYDVAKAQALLAAAGYPKGKGFPELTISYNTNEGHKAIAEYVQQELYDNLGINVTLENSEWKTFLKTRRAGDFQVARNGWIGDYLDPNTFLELYTAGGGSNEVQYANPEYDALLAKSSRTKDVATRMGLLKQAESLLIEKDIALIPIYYYTSANMFDNTKWEGFYSNIANVHNLKFIKPKQ